MRKKRKKLSPSPWEFRIWIFFSFNFPPLILWFPSSESESLFQSSVSSSFSYNPLFFFVFHIFSVSTHFRGIFLHSNPSPFAIPHSNGQTLTITSSLNLLWLLSFLPSSLMGAPINDGKMEGWLYLIRSNRFGLQYSQKRYFVLQDDCLKSFKSVPVSENEVLFPLFLFHPSFVISVFSFLFRIWLSVYFVELFLNHAFFFPFIKHIWLDSGWFDSLFCLSYCWKLDKRYEMLGSTLFMLLLLSYLCGLLGFSGLWMWTIIALTEILIMNLQWARPSRKTLCKLYKLVFNLSNPWLNSWST